MENFLIKNRKAFLILFQNLFFLCLILIFFNQFTNLSIDQFINLNWLISLSTVTFFVWFFFFIKKNEIYYKEKTESYFKYCFLFGLFLTTLASLKFEFLNKFIPLKNTIDFLSKQNLILAVLTMGLGFFIFYFSRERIEKEIEEEQNQEKQIEQKRMDEFPEKFPKINKIPLIKNLIGWMYKERWGYILGFIGIVILFFLTRLYNTDFINGSDNYNVLGIKNSYENGVSFYKYSPITDFLMLQTVELIGFNLFSIKLPFVFYSFITLIFIYLISNLYNKKLSLLSSFLYTISPWAIIQTRITRDYSFDLMITSIVIYLCFVLYTKIKLTDDIKKCLKYTGYFSLIPLGILLLYQYDRQQILVAGLFVLIFSLLLINHLSKIIIKNNPIFNYYYWTTIFFILLIGLYFIKRSPFEFGFLKPNFIFFEIFFNSLINSPYQWFHGLNFNALILFGFFVLGIFSFNQKKISPKHFSILFISFIFGLFIYIYKYETHVNYIPVRYVYFLFIPYIIIFSNAILNLLKFFKNQSIKIFLILFLIVAISPTAILYSIDPKLEYRSKGISNLQIDNIGIGRFAMIDVVSCLKNELNITNNTILVLDGRYGEFILLLNRPMDSERKLDRPSGGIYDIAKNTFVQSNYFGYSELTFAINNYQSGFYITQENTVLNQNKEVVLDLSKTTNVVIDNIELKFIKKIDTYKIYSWKKRF